MNTDQMTPTPTPRTDAERIASGHEGIPATYLHHTFCEEIERQLEREIAAERAQLAANHEATALMGKWLAAEQALADRLAGELQSWGDSCGDSAPASIDLVLAAWKEVRSGSD